MPAPRQRSVLITGCTDGSAGAALALAFHAAGLRVYATAREPARAAGLAAAGVEVLTLDVLSGASIAACAAAVAAAGDGALDILVNNAGEQGVMPVADADLARARRTFELNVWAPVAVAQAFLPLLLRAPAPLLANHTSLAAVVALPFQGVYAASKAALAALSGALRLELRALGVRVVELRSGGVRTGILRAARLDAPPLPAASALAPARPLVDAALRQDALAARGIPADAWARAVAADLLRPAPPRVVRRGESAWLDLLLPYLPAWLVDKLAADAVGFAPIEAAIRDDRAKKLKAH
ncbi:hypothetical protein GGS23DRAFT_612734 [Durotheca rogersii]|uniref:uncharacterized protein n=1 Tax=Durotheca rogersii TaxID=419775 RepID=UPI00221F74D3|nr:uncharacterized protein GGS23DRAFT_612734 [Durotheca rogersii]KAI5867585.1 hypothetical protein GGS23DRAFT_612734 [Durotheca rogersii]